MATIFHLALASEWAAAQAGGAYTTSTLGRSLAEEGFIHASRADQWTGVRDRFYAAVAEPLVLLQIDTDLLDVPVIDEPPAPGAQETFPHIYGRLPVSAVVRATPLPAPAGAAASQPPTSQEPTSQEPASQAPASQEPTGRPRAAASAGPAESFSRLYFREMFFNVAVVCIAILASTAGLVVGLALGGDRAPGIGGLIGLALGVVLAVAAYRRRHPRSA